MGAITAEAMATTGAAGPARTTYASNSTVWTTDPSEERFLIPRLEAGAVFVNGMSVPYAELPLGGVKDSGLSGSSPRKASASSATSRRSKGLTDPPAPLHGRPEDAHPGRGGGTAGRPPAGGRPGHAGEGSGAP